MPIHRDTHPDDVELRPGTTVSDIVVFLYRNLDFAYSPSEIADELGVPNGTATTTLHRLHERGILGRIETGYYHGFEDREDLRRYARSVAETADMFTTHPDATDAPEPEPARAAEVDAVDDDALDAEVDELEAELDG